MAEVNVDQDTGDYDGKKSWPAWFYGPKGQSEIFNTEEEVPEGWADHPSKVGKGRQQKQPEPVTESPYKGYTDAQVIDELKKRKVDFNDRWPRPKLEQLLLTDDEAKKGK